MLSQKIEKNLITSSSDNDIYSPVFFRIYNNEERNALSLLLDSNPHIKISDTIWHQLKELIKTLNPSQSLSPSEIESGIKKHLDGLPLMDYGVWVYYPWKDSLVHILDEKEFISLRTNRNRYKITQQEQDYLAGKTIGVVGLSVGQAVALTIAMERVCGHLRLADFDTLDLSNLNRLRAGVSNIGLKKTIIAAREILELDPFFDVKLFNDGITEDTINDFFTKDGKVDILVEVCDGLDVKILSRYKAKELGIPVVMETNDKGMVDIERFDLEPNRAILHGLATGLDPKNIKGLTNEEKVPYILKMVGVDTLSTRLKASMLEVQQSISTWPQLASSVALGGALTTDICRRILLGQFHESGRYYVDLDEIIRDKENTIPAKNNNNGRPDELTLEKMKTIAGRYTSESSSRNIEDDLLKQIINAARLAPSGGNAQPWKFLNKDNRIFIFHDAYFSYSLLDFNNIGSYIGFGAMIENIELTASSLGLSMNADIFPVIANKELIAVISFTNNDVIAHPLHYLAPMIAARVTNRNLTERKLLNKEDKNALMSVAATIPGAKLQLFDQDDNIAQFADILTRPEMLRFLHPNGHYDIFVNELRFTKEEIEASGDGMDIHTLNMSEADKAALQIARDPSAISFLHTLQKGEGFTKISRKSILGASAIGVMSMDGHDALHFLQGGKAIERVWLEANFRSIAFQPISQIIFMIERCLATGSNDFNAYEIEELRKINESFNKLTGLAEQGRFPIFVFRFFYGAPPKLRSLRKSIDKVMFVS